MSDRDDLYRTLKVGKINKKNRTDRLTYKSRMSFVCNIRLSTSLFILFCVSFQNETSPSSLSLSLSIIDSVSLPPQSSSFTTHDLRFPTVSWTVTLTYQETLNDPRKKDTPTKTKNFSYLVVIMST